MPAVVPAQRTAISSRGVCGLILILVLVATVSQSRLHGQVARWSLTEPFEYAEATDLPIESVLGVAVAPDGTVFVTGRGDARVHQLSREGDYVRTIGGEGEGPGEFQRTPPIALQRDTLWVFDQLRLRAAAFDSSGRLLTERSVTPRYSARGLSYEPQGRLAGGRVLAAEPAQSSRRYDFEAAGRAFLIQEPNGMDGGVLSRLDMSDVWLAVELPGMEGAGMVTVQPWSGRDLLAIAPDGSEIVTATEIVPEGPNARYVVTRYAASGELTRRDSVRYAATPLASAEIEDFVSRLVTGLAADLNVSAGALRRELEGSLHRPEFLPGVGQPDRSLSGGGVVVASDGAVWIRHQGVETEGRWIVLGANGERLAEVDVPADLSIRQVTPLEVWGVKRDALGVSHIYRYRITRQSGSGLH